jgi:cobalamin biosynthesis Mg chelatase CobN
VRLLAVLAAVLLTAGIAAGTAAAKQPSCSKQVVNDWYENGRVDKIYPLACYRDAIKSLPVDVIDYSNAKEEIGRALAYAKQGKPDPGPKPTTSTTSTGTTSTGTTSTGTTSTGTTSTGTTSTGTTSTDAATTATEATVDTSGPSSVPIPLIVLGGLAVLLLAAGSAGYLARRAKAGKGDDDGTPPASA